MPLGPDPIFITKRDALEIHARSIATAGGLDGVRDEGLLESALAMPPQSVFGEYVHNTIFEMAAAYLYHIARNHPFIDGNKRTALGCAALFMLLNGHELAAPVDLVVGFVNDVASGTASKIDAACFLERHSVPADPN